MHSLYVAITTLVKGNLGEKMSNTYFNEYFV